MDIPISEQDLFLFRINHRIGKNPIYVITIIKSDRLRRIVYGDEGIKDLKYNIMPPKYNFILHKNNVMHHHLRIRFLIKLKEVGQYHKLFNHHNVQEGNFHKPDQVLFQIQRNLDNSHKDEFIP